MRKSDFLRAKTNAVSFIADSHGQRHGDPIGAFTFILPFRPPAQKQPIAIISSMCVRFYPSRCITTCDQTSLHYQFWDVSIAPFGSCAGQGGDVASEGKRLAAEGEQREFNPSGLYPSYSVPAKPH
jgi:hypothetical protein